MSEQQGHHDRREQAAERLQGRTTAEWVTLGISLLIALVVVGLLVYDLVAGSNAPPMIAIEPDYNALHQVENFYYLPVTVSNRGGQTAEDVTIHFVLQREVGDSENTSLTFRFLAPGENARATLIFNTDPETGTLTHTSNYLQP